MLRSYVPVSVFLKKALSFWLVLMLFAPVAFAVEESVKCPVDRLLQPAPGKTIDVGSVSELYRVVRSVYPGSVILLDPGEYKLTSTVAIRFNDISIRGNGDGCGDVVIKGAGI